MEGCILLDDEVVIMLRVAQVDQYILLSDDMLSMFLRLNLLLADHLECIFLLR